MPTQASLAAGVIQTAYRLSVSIGLGVTYAVYTSAQQTLRGIQDPTLPYVRAYLCGIGFAAVGLIFIPFMQLDMQGDTTLPTKTERPFIDEAQESPPRAASEYRDSVGEEPARILTSEPSQSSIRTAATCGSQATYFQRWSWEDDPYWPLKSGEYNEHSKNADVLYEVCIKCLEERRVILPVRTSDDGHNHDSPVMYGEHGWV